MRTRTGRAGGPDSAELARRLRARENGAMEELYDRFGALVYNLALQRVRDRAAAEDLTQETFLTVWLRIGSFDAERGTLAAWICAMARNRAVDYVRSVEWRMAQASEEWTGGESGWEGVARWERARLLEGAWGKLEARQREVLRLAHWSGMSQTEIAERLRAPLGTVKTWMRGAHRALRAAMEAADAH